MSRKLKPESQLTPAALRQRHYAKIFAGQRSSLYPELGPQDIEPTFNAAGKQTGYRRKRCLIDYGAPQGFPSGSGIVPLSGPSGAGFFQDVGRFVSGKKTKGGIKQANLTPLLDVVEQVGHLAGPKGVAAAKASRELRSSAAGRRFVRGRAGLGDVGALTGVAQSIAANARQGGRLQKSGRGTGLPGRR